MLKINSLYFLLILSLVGCNEDTGLLDINNVDKDDPITLKPEIIKLDIVGFPIIGSDLSLEVNCNNCVTYNYSWAFGDNIVGVSSSYLFEEKDLSKNLTLTVTAYNGAGDKTTATNVYKQHGVRDIVTNGVSWGALLLDGSVKTWGFAKSGGDSSSVANELSSGVKSLEVTGFYNTWTLGAIKESGQAIVWGRVDHGADPAEIPYEELKTGVKDIIFTTFSVAALKEDGSVVWWERGTTSPTPEEDVSDGILQVIPFNAGFMALKEGGKVINLDNSSDVFKENAEKFKSDIKQLVTSYAAIAGLTTDGAVVMANLFAGYYVPFDAEAEKQLESGVNYLVTNANYGTGEVATIAMFGAIKDDGIVFWGTLADDGKKQASGFHPLKNIDKVVASRGAFAALTTSGAVHVFGLPRFGGQVNAVDLAGVLASGVKEIVNNERAFVALLDNGSVFSWGESIYGGSMPADVQELLSSNVKKVYSTRAAFAALKDNGEVVTWGSINHGADSSAVKDALSSGVYDITAGTSTFLAKKTDGTFVAWGQEQHGGVNDALPHDKISFRFELLNSSLN